MAKEKMENCDCVKWHNGSYGAMGGCFYFLAMIGAAVYYVQLSHGFWMGVVGVLKALVWPAMLIYKVFTMLNM